MAKKDKKSKKDKMGGSTDAVRSAVERALQEGAGGARGLLDEVTQTATRLKGEVDDLRNLRKQVDELQKRVSALEAAGSKARTTASRTARTTSSARSTASKPASSRAKSTASKPAASRAKSTSSRSTGTRSRSTASRARSSGSGSS